MTPQGYVIGLTNGPLRKKRYINHNIERELVKFKDEIEEKHSKGKTRDFKMPRTVPSRGISKLGEMT